MVAVLQIIFYITFSIDNKRALVQILAWRRTGDEPLFEKNDGLDWWRIYACLDLNVLTDTVTALRLFKC